MKAQTQNIKIELYDGAKIVVVFHIGEENVTVRSGGRIPDWLSRVVSYVYRHGVRREVMMYNPVMRRQFIWQFYVAEIPSEELLRMIKSANWQRSEHARKLITLLERVA